MEQRTLGERYFDALCALLAVGRAILVTDDAHKARVIEENWPVQIIGRSDGAGGGHIYRLVARRAVEQLIGETLNVSDRVLCYHLDDLGVLGSKHTRDTLHILDLE